MPHITNPPRTPLSLSSGKQVWFESVHLEPTWGGWLEGRPNVADCEERLADLRADACEAWDLEAVFMAHEPGSDDLPAFACRALLTAEPEDERDSPSILGVVWLQDEMEFPPNTDIVNKLAQIPWDQWAQIEGDW